MADRRDRRTDASTQAEPRLSPADREQLADFDRRRAAFEHALAASNILHHKHTCPACGFPTLDSRFDYLRCVICLWEDGVGEEDPTRARPPNDESLVDARLRISALLAACDLPRDLAAATDDIVRGIRRFEADLRRGAAAIDVDDFAHHLRTVLPGLFERP